MSFSTNPYCAASDVTTALGLNSASSDYAADQAFIAQLIPQAQQAIDEYLGYSFQIDGTPAAPSTRVYSGNDNDQLFIDYCQQLVSVTEQIPVLTTGWDGNLIVSPPLTRDITADVVLGPDNVSPGYLLTRPSGNDFTFGRANYTVKGVWGFTAVPATIQRACIRLAVHYFKMRDTGYADSISEQGGVRTVYMKQMPVDVIELLEHKRRRLFLAW